MLQSYEAEIDRNGNVRLREPLRITGPCRALVTVLEPAEPEDRSWLVMSESALAEDWDNPEEDAAWAHLQPGR